MSQTQALQAQLCADLTIAWRNQSQSITGVLFLLMVVVLFTISLEPSAALLLQIAPGMLWVVTLLASIINLDAIFRSDFDDGHLEQMLLAQTSLPWLVATKALAHWFVNIVPLLLFLPFAAVMLGLPLAAIKFLLLSLLLGTPILSLIGALASALTLGLRQGGVLLALIVLPLYTPILIFGSGLVQAAISGFAIAGQTALLLAFLLLAIALLPFLTAQALKVSLS